MANLTSVFRDEIRRQARKELKTITEEFRRRLIEQRKEVTALKRRVEALEKQNNRLHKRMQKAEPDVEASAQPEEKPAVDRARFSGKNIQRMRQKLRLTQPEMAKLAGVSPQSVYQWESKEGPLRLRKSTKEALLRIRGMGIREARRALESS
ncbi:MAG: helix-turn-helix domain-containing protein [Candidatus Hydrogenedentota bacterium]